MHGAIIPPIIGEKETVMIMIGVVGLIGYVVYSILF